VAKRLPAKLHCRLHKLIWSAARRGFDETDLIAELKRKKGGPSASQWLMLAEMERVPAQMPRPTPWAAAGEVLKGYNHAESFYNRKRQALSTLYQEWRVLLEMLGILLGHAVYKRERLKIHRELTSLREAPETPTAIARIAELTELKSHIDIELPAMREHARAITRNAPIGGAQPHLEAQGRAYTSPWRDIGRDKNRENFCL
jgi:hypothetical protein